MADINTYSLSLNLDVQSNADAVLDDTVGLLSDIQSQLDKMSGSIGVGMKDASAQVANAISDIAKQSAVAETSMASMVPQMAAAGASAESSATYYADLVDSLEDAVEEHENITDELTDQEELLKDALEHHDDIEDSVERQIGLYDDITNSLDNNIKRLRTTVLGLEAMSRVWGMLIRDEERFVTANYRLYGSQREMIDQVSKITDEYGLMYDNAIEAYTALATELRVPQEELAKYTEQVTKFNRITNANVQVTAEWVKMMKFVGYTSKDTERMLGRMTEAMEKYGLSTGEVESHLQAMTANTGKAIINWGKDQEDAYQKADLQLRSLARGLDNMQDYFGEALITPGKDAGLMLRSLAEDHDDYAKAIKNLSGVELDRMKVQLGTMELYKQLQDEWAGATTSQDRALAAEAILEGVGKMSGPEAAEAIVMFEKWEDAGIKATDTIEEQLAKLVSKLDAAEFAQYQYEKSMDTLAGAWGRATSSMETAFMQMATAIAPQVIYLIENVLMPIIDIVKTIVKVITAGFKLVMIAFYPVIKIVQALVAVFRGFWSVIDGVLEPFLEIIDIIYKTLFEGAEAGASFADTFQFIGKVIGYVITYALQPLVWMAKRVAWSLKWMKVNLSDFGKVVEAVLFPFGAIIGKIEDNIKGLSSWFNNLTEEGSKLNSVVSTLGGVLSIVSPQFKTLQSVIESVVGWFGASGAGIIEESEWLTDAFNKLATTTQFITNVIQAVGRAMEIGAESVDRLINSVMDLGKNWDKMLVGAGIMTAFAGAVLTSAGMIFAGSSLLAMSGPMFVAGMSALALGLLFLDVDKVTGMAEALWLLSTGIYEIGKAKDQLTGVGDAMYEIADQIKSIVSSAMASVSVYVSYVLSAVAGVYSVAIMAGSAVKMLAHGLIGAIHQVVSMMPMLSVAMFYVSDMLQSAAREIQWAAVTVWYTMQSMVNAIDNGISNIMAAGTRGYFAMQFVSSMFSAGASGMLGLASYLGYVYDVIVSVISAGMDRIESEAQRAWAIMVPLQFMAGGLGLSLTDLMDIGKYFDKPIQAETISQIQVLTNEGEGGQASQEAKETRWRDEELKLLSSINGKLEVIGAGEVTPGLDDIKKLLATHLPRMAKTPNKLGTSMNDWG